MYQLDAYRESVVSFSGRNLAWLDWTSKSQGIPILCLHALLGQSHDWDFTAASLRGDSRVIAPDFRGHGESDFVDPPSYTPSDYTADIISLLKRLKLGRVSVIGHGMGGMVGLVLAGSYPDLVDRLIVVEQEARCSPKYEEYIHALGNLGKESLFDYNSMREAARIYIPDISEDTLDWLMPYLFKRVSRGYSFKWDPEVLATVQTWNMEPWLARIRCPVLLVRGSRSEIMRPGPTQAMAQEIDDCEVMTVSNSGHQIMLEHPDKFQEIVTLFLQKSANN